MKTRFHYAAVAALLAVTAVSSAAKATTRPPGGCEVTKTCGLGFPVALEARALTTRVLNVAFGTKALVSEYEQKDVCQGEVLPGSTGSLESPQAILRPYRISSAELTVRDRFLRAAEGDDERDAQPFIREYRADGRIVVAVNQRAGQMNVPLKVNIKARFRMNEVGAQCVVARSAESRREVIRSVLKTCLLAYARNSLMGRQTTHDDGIKLGFDAAFPTSDDGDNGDRGHEGDRDGDHHRGDGGDEDNDNGGVCQSHQDDHSDERGDDGSSNSDDAISRFKELTDGKLRAAQIASYNFGLLNTAALARETVDAVPVEITAACSFAAPIGEVGGVISKQP